MIRAACSALTTSRACATHRTPLRTLSNTAPTQHARHFTSGLPSPQQPSAMVKGAKRAREDVKAGSAAAAAATDGVTNTPDLKHAGLAKDLVGFINHAWTPYHAVEEASRRLLAAGFQHISEKGAWDVKPGGKYFFTRNYSTIVAFAVGEKFAPGNGFYMIGAHTDSPCLKLRPVTKSTKSGYLMVNIETYGGGLWYTWFDRDLGLAGRVLVRAKADDGSETIAHRLVKIERPIMRIPMLAIHLQRDIHSAGFKPNLQTNFAPILATAAKAQLGLESAPAAAAAAGDNSTPAATAVPVPTSGAASGAAAAAGSSAAVPGTTGAGAGAASNGAGAASAKDAGPVSAKHHQLLMDMVAGELGMAPADIVDFELHLCDTQPGVLGGAHNEFIFCGRLDNLAMSYVALQSLIDTCQAPGALAEERGVRAIALFDHEEVGSESAQGAGGPVMRDTIKRVARALSGGEEGAVERSMCASFLVSADMAHALHPNYADKHEPDHQPKFHEGLVLKHNASQRYATNAVSAALFREVGRRHGIPCQEFSVRNDTPCGSTIGPILSAILGCRTVDVGVAQLSMHSIREMCGTDDIDISYKHFVAFFQDMSKLDETLDVDSLPPPNLLGTMRDVTCNHVH